MNPHFFFEGLIKKELATSAFLATLLEFSSNFREYFFKLCKLTEPDGQCEVKTEDHNVDIIIKYPNDIIIIENKVSQNALQIDQLIRYYQNTKKKNKESRIFVILVSPTINSGHAEIKRLKESPDFSENDKVSHISWKQLIDYPVSANDEKEFIESGFNCIKKIITPRNRAQRNEDVWEMMKNVENELQKAYPDQFRLHISKMKNTYWIYPKKPFEITFYLISRIKKDNNVEISTEFKLSGAGNKNRIIRSNWEELRKQKNVQIKGIGQHELHNDGWFKRKENFGVINNSLEEKLTDYGKKMIDFTLEFIHGDV